MQQQPKCYHDAEQKRGHHFDTTKKHWFASLATTSQEKYGGVRKRHREWQLKLSREWSSCLRKRNWNKAAWGYKENLQNNKSNGQSELIAAPVLTAWIREHSIKLKRGHFKTDKRQYIFTQWVEKFWNLLLEEVVRQILMAGPSRI